MKRPWLPTIAGCCAFVLCTLGAAQEKQTKPQAPSAANAQDTASSQATAGERLFRTHCGRCHNPPESISPREARAVVRHMRVRATLSTEDEKLILKFLAP
jgi:mono/diheme cytochrome c family protein